jgi:hypothetical protein
MVRSIVLAILLLAGLGGQACADGYARPYGTTVKPPPKVWTYRAPPGELPFPRGPRAQAVWDANACWSQCGAYCAWAMASCLETTPQGTCLLYTDSCDRHCLRSCRTLAGPLLPLD